MHNLLNWTAMLIAALSASAAPVSADGAWLDQPLVSWNEPGMAIPAAPPPSPFTDSRCERQHRPAETAEDEAVAAAGWTLFGAYQSGWGLRLIYGLAGHDGMCRPLEYQEFVFVNGVFAGTISPSPMNARTDGAENRTFISDGESLLAQFVRYRDSDPLCCPWGTSSVQYRINLDAAAPVLLPSSVYTGAQRLAE
jgi:hypothetical protein